MAQPQGVKNSMISEIGLALFVILLIILLICELPPIVVNFAISFNITLGILLLMFSLYIQKPLELSSFPSIILIGTMFRLVLSIASTRLSRTVICFPKTLIFIANTLEDEHLS